jgi:hypothetical protein
MRPSGPDARRIELHNDGGWIPGGISDELRGRRYDPSRDRDLHQVENRFSEQIGRPESDLHV